MSQKRNLLRTCIIVFGLFLSGIPLALLLAGQFGDDGGTASTLIFLLFIEDAAYPHSQHEQPQANYPQEMT